jgi:hypothetical protein
MRLFICVLCGVLEGAAVAQPVGSSISGRVLDAVTGQPLAGASATARCGKSETMVATGARGAFSLRFSGTGNCRVRVSAQGYQTKILSFPSTSSVKSLLIQLRPLSDVWESSQRGSVYLPGSRQVLTFFGPDVDVSRSVFVPSGGDSRDGQLPPIPSSFGTGAAQTGRAFFRHGGSTA